VPTNYSQFRQRFTSYFFFGEVLGKLDCRIGLVKYQQSNLIASFMPLNHWKSLIADL
jgi:hypothetical protein